MSSTINDAFWYWHPHDPAFLHCSFTGPILMLVATWSRCLGELTGPETNTRNRSNLGASLTGCTMMSISLVTLMRPASCRDRSVIVNTTLHVPNMSGAASKISRRVDTLPVDSIRGCP